MSQRVASSSSNSIHHQQAYMNMPEFQGQTNDMASMPQIAHQGQPIELLVKQLQERLAGQQVNEQQVLLNLAENLRVGAVSVDDLRTMGWSDQQI